MDMTAIMRSTNPGNGLGTNFSAFPFTTTASGAPNPTGNLGETRFSAQNSRITLQATSKVGGASLKGYLEADFLGNTAQNLNITSNSDTLRLRLYWAQYQQGKFEFLAGQSWSLLVPNRNGLSPVPGDLFYSQDVDTNYQMGLTWGRVPQFRFIVHASDAVSAGVSIENPEQYVGSAVVLPASFVAGEVNTGSGSSAVGPCSPTPNPYPDIIGKIAFDPKTGSTHQHIDAAVLVSGFKTLNPTTNTTFTQNGVGGALTAAVELAPRFAWSAPALFLAAPLHRLYESSGLDRQPRRQHDAGDHLAGGSAPRFRPPAKRASMPVTARWARPGEVATDVDAARSDLACRGSTAANERISESAAGHPHLLRDPRLGHQLMGQSQQAARLFRACRRGDASVNMII